ncbi:MAG: hypothetical protein ACRYFK_12155 [Janthinobacterium lividum]
MPTKSAPPCLLLIAFAALLAASEPFWVLLLGWWLLQHAPPARMATYAYVNPMAAVGLGAAQRAA